MNFSTKERLLLEDQKNQEQICVQKYQNYANMASCNELKSIFQQNGQKEQEHYNTIDQLLKGQMPSMGQQSGGQQQSWQQSGGQTQMQQQSGGQTQMQQQSGGGQQKTGGQKPSGQQSMQMQSQQSKMNQQSFQPQGSSSYSNSDKDLCTDMLMTEKYVSGVYDTAIFEFRDPQVRNILNHIQKEEQQHGEAIFKYMESKGMYQVK